MTLRNQITDYFVWADKSIFAIIDRLTDAEVTRPFGEYDKSIYHICCHVAEDHWWWYNYVTPQGFGNKPDFTTMSKGELVKTIADYRKKWATLVDNAPFDTFTLNFKERTLTVSFEELIFHIINHATYHRGQLALALRFLGKNVPFTDYVPYRKG